MHQLEVGLAHGVEERLAGVELQALAELGRLDLLVPLEDQVADLVPGPLGDHEGQVDVAQARSRPGHRRDLDLEEALGLVVLRSLRASSSSMSRWYLPPTRPRIGLRLLILVQSWASEAKTLPLKSTLSILNLGPSKIWKTTLVSPMLPPSTSLTCGQLVALLLVEPLDLPQGQPGLGGVGAVADLEVGVLLDLLLRSAFRPRNSTELEDGHLADPEDQDVLAALGRASS